MSFDSQVVLARGKGRGGSGESDARGRRDGDPRRRHPRLRPVLKYLKSGHRDMPELSTLSDTPAAASRATPSKNLRHVLEFEKPLAKLEQQIHELEALQAAKQLDYTKELRQLRSNY